MTAVGIFPENNMNILGMTWSKAEGEAIGLLGSLTRLSEIL